jgi:hypothetical protein
MTFKKKHMLDQNEHLQFSNTFGSVTDKRIVLNYKNGSEEIPIGQITSISFQKARNMFMSIFSFIISILLIVYIIAIVNSRNSEGGIFVLIASLIFILSVLSGIANWIGHHNIAISAGGKDRKPIKVEMSKTREGKDFVNAIKKLLFK